MIFLVFHADRLLENESFYVAGPFSTVPAFPRVPCWLPLYTAPALSGSSLSNPRAHIVGSTCSQADLPSPTNPIAVSASAKGGLLMGQFAGAFSGQMAASETDGGCSRGTGGGAILPFTAVSEGWL